MNIKITCDCGNDSFYLEMPRKTGGHALDVICTKCGKKEAWDD